MALALNDYKLLQMKFEIGLPILFFIMITSKTYDTSIYGGNLYYKIEYIYWMQGDMDSFIFLRNKN